jgi:transketolase
MNWSVDTDRAESDVFILSKGHGVPAWYSALIVSKEIDEKYKLELRKIDSPLQGHPDTNKCNWVDASTGALGQGLSMALGRAKAKQLKKQNNYVYCIIGDGECQEGQIWEAFLYAGYQKITNIIVFLDYNKRQNDGYIENILSLEPLSAKLISFNWNVQEIDGHSHYDISNAIETAKNAKNIPSIIIANTKK